MIKQPTTYLRLPPDVRRMARLAAAAADMTLSQYVAQLVRQDTDRSGVASIVLGSAKEVKP